MTDKQIIFKCDVDCIRKNTEECFELDCIKGQESILKQLKRKEQECEELKKKCNIYTCGICGNKEDCNKLYKTLTEIKEIARVGAFYWKHYKEESKRYNEILQKISEVEDG